jgi:TusE/DsrC/DsvC family sulfur relay protein
VPAITYRNLKVQVDDEGYLVNFEDWNEDIACAIAEREGLSHECPLTQEKIDILRFMREYYKKHNSFPLLKAVCKNIHQPKSCTYEQFPDPIKAWKIAGLPKPTTEVFAYIRHNP